MHEAGLILTLAGSLAAALVCGYATHRIGLSPIVGYLAAGLLVGPYTPGFVAAEIIRVALSLNPGVRTFVRGSYLRDAPALAQAGAQRVFTGEGEVALAMTEAVLRELGATPEQIEWERARAREELFGGSHAAAS